MAAAVIPAFVLLIYIYRADRLEPEPPQLLANLVFWGALSTLLAMVIETVGSSVLDRFTAIDTTTHNLILYFVIVGGAEEGGKYLVLKNKTWNSPFFNCTYDGVIYAAFVSLGFALWENVQYVFSYGFGTAVIRAVTAVPGHACFGVFMGAFYGLAKKYDTFGYHATSTAYRVLSVLVPIALHGAYDYVASEGSAVYTIIFFVFIVIMFIGASSLVKKMSNEDEYI